MSKDFALAAEVGAESEGGSLLVAILGRFGRLPIFGDNISSSFDDNTLLMLSLLGTLNIEPC
jgi:hypothetical protein